MLIKAQYLKASLLFAGTKDIRDCINGVMLEVRNSNVRLVATDGHRLSVFNCGCASGVPDMEFIIPREVIERLKLKDGHVEITFHDKLIKLSYNNATIQTDSIYGKFPDYRRVIPRDPMSGLNAQFQTSYLADLDKAWKILNPGSKLSNAYIVHNGEGSAIIDLNCVDFIGVIMPLRFASLRAVPQSIPGWALS